MTSDLIKAADELAKAVEAWEACDNELCVEDVIDNLAIALRYYQDAREATRGLFNGLTDEQKHAALNVSQDESFGPPHGPKQINTESEDK